MAENSGFIKKEDVKFWMAIIIVVVGYAVSFTKLQSKVEAMVSREQTNKEQFFKVVGTVDKLLRNQIIIGTTLGIEGLEK